MFFTKLATLLLAPPFSYTSTDLDIFQLPPVKSDQNQNFDVMTFLLEELR